MRSWRATEGQAASEYVALVALVGVALALAAGLTSGGLGSHVLAGLQRGLCRVSAGACPRPLTPRPDLPPCPLEDRVRSERLAGAYAVAHLAAGASLGLARGSDGRVTVTLASDDAAGGEVGVGIHLPGRDGALGRRVHAEGVVTWSSGRSWTLPDLAAARRFVATYGAKATVGGRVVDAVRSRCSLLCDAVGWRPHAPLPPADERYEEGGAPGALRVALGADRGEASLAASAVLGRRVRRDGATTWYLRVGGAASGALRLPGAELAGAVAHEAVASFELDPRGRPVAFGLQLAVEAGGGAGLAGEAGRGEASADRGAGRLVELEATLDLHGPARRGAAATLLGALRQPGRLAARIAREGRIDRRTYAVRESGASLGASVGAGAPAELGFERTTRGLRLLHAETRLPGLPFLPRDDCRPA